VSASPGDPSDPAAEKLDAAWKVLQRMASGASGAAVVGALQTLAQLLGNLAASSGEER
jgi:hypothetical protein